MGPLLPRALDWCKTESRDTLSFLVAGFARTDEIAWNMIGQSLDAVPKAMDHRSSIINDYYLVL